MGEFMRQYWIPALLSTELPDPDSAPLRVRLLCENLIAFRSTSGRVGIFANACPHRGASLFFGRNEEDGLRCVYHGWKFDVTGACVDMPSEPAESNFKSKVSARSYPCIERGGLVWTYMGPRTTPPDLPDIEPNMVAQGSVRAGMIECNWLQAIENNMDTSHAGFLHFGAIPVNSPDPEFIKAYPDDWKNYIVYKSPKFNVINAPYGASYAASRPADDEGETYYRIMNFLFPFFTQSPTNDLVGGACAFSATVPVDDEHTISFGMRVGRPVIPPGNNPSVPNSTDWLGRFRPAITSATDYNIDRELQSTDKTWRGYTGISTSVPEQDRAITESCGVIADRSIEHLGTTDSMIIRVRRRLLEAVKTFQEAGEIPGAFEPGIYRQRSGHIVLSNGVDVWEATRDLREAFRRTEEEAPRINV
jgi:phenylpropionate dioxygenase-like ring-hydroxylating dioxygenase large terminal subunit